MDTDKDFFDGEGAKSAKKGITSGEKKKKKQFLPQRAQRRKEGEIASVGSLTLPRND
jgi:hypothetical protein